MTYPNLGEEMHMGLIAIRDRLDEAGALRLLDMVIDRIKMLKVCHPAVWTYPLAGGVTGGTGETVLQPFGAAQPLAESLSLVLSGGAVMTDSWHEHEGFYLCICSCRPFGVGSLARWLRRKGWKVADSTYGYVTLRKKPKSTWLRRLIGG
jgi:hypothetical protein